jgi:RimJ/RimL family protein N-acetyltransferase
MIDMSAHRQSTLRPVYPIRTGRLLLRPLTVGDVDALLTYRSRPDVCRYLTVEPMTREVINERLASLWANTELTAEGQALTLGVEVAETGELIGDVVLFWHSREHGGGEIGYALHPDFGGLGYATEAARALLRLGFDELGLHRIIARIDERNEASAKLARRLRKPAWCTTSSSKESGAPNLTSRCSPTNGPRTAASHQITAHVAPPGTVQPTQACAPRRPNDNTNRCAPTSFRSTGRYLSAPSAATEETVALARHLGLHLIHDCERAVSSVAMTCAGVISACNCSESDCSPASVAGQSRGLSDRLCSLALGTMWRMSLS